MIVIYLFISLLLKASVDKVLFLIKRILSVLLKSIFIYDFIYALSQILITLMHPSF